MRIHTGSSADADRKNRTGSSADAGRKNHTGCSAAGGGRRGIFGCGGTTLVEVVVSFALISIFLLAATSALSTALDTFSRMQATTHAITVSDTILDKIEGELSSAMADSGQIHVGTVSGVSAVSFYTGSGSPVYLSAGSASDGKNYLVMHYYPVLGGDAYDWSFDSKMYQGFSIASLEFSLESVSPSVIVRASLTLDNGNVTYQEERYIQCNNFYSASHLASVASGVAIDLSDPKADVVP